MTAASGAPWHLVAEVHGSEAASAVFAILDETAAALSAFETAPLAWRIEAYPPRRLLTPALTARLTLAAIAAGGALVEIAETRLPERDWLAENRLAFPPLRIGRFFVYGSHHQGGVPTGTIGIMVDAAAAFGTGEHPSTRACLMALDLLARRRRFRRPVDIGTGTGILAIAAAKMLRRCVGARDLDAGAVRIARHNVAHNGVVSLVRVGPMPGYRGRNLRRKGHDLVFANILARPLALQAADLGRHLAPGGRAVLSGLLKRQEPIVLAPHRGVGIVLERRLVVDGWSTLILRSRRRYA
jgi:ribosomal protein L11 methyltransferase